MPRHARRHSPGALVHIIVRFVNRDHRIVGPHDRRIALETLGRALQRSDWTAHGYALMSSHLHLAATAGDAPIAHLLQPWLVPLARWLNDSQGRTGPVVAERAKSVYMPQRLMGRLVRYIHNNPVRAGLAYDARESDWTSHRAWIDDNAPRPAWLAVDAGLRAAGFAASERGRAAFDAFVREAAGDPRDAVLTGRSLTADRAAVRAATALPLELSSSAMQSGRAAAWVMSMGMPCAPARWEGDLADVVQAAATAAGCTSTEVRSRSRRRQVVLARRIAVIAAVWFLRRAVNEVAAAVGISDTSASRLQHRGDSVFEAARRVAELMRATTRT